MYFLLIILLVINFLLSNRIKRLGIALLSVPAIQAIALIFSPVHASDSLISSGDNILILTSSALVLLMTPGLAFFYGGFTQAKNVLNTMIMSIVMMGISTIVWLIFGFSLAFSDGGALNTFIGNPFTYLFFENLPEVWDGLQIPGLSFALFQGMFAIITPALISGALVERISFKFWCFFTPIWLLFVYSPLAHMVWGGGLLGKDLDFAGGTVVHISSGVTALVLASIVGSRMNWPEGIKPPHDVTQILLGTGLLWFGWFGFNGGSQLAVNGAEIPFTTTHISAAAGLISWGLIEYLNEGKSTAVGMATGAISGLVGITPAAGFVNPVSGMIIGLITSIFCYFSVKLKNKLRFDDSLDTFAVHGVGGTVGAILTGFFAKSELISSHPAGQILIEKGRLALISGQFQAVFIAYGLSALGTLVIVYLISALGINLRVTQKEEIKGLDITQHREKSYSEEWVQK